MKMVHRLPKQSPHGPAKAAPKKAPPVNSDTAAPLLGERLSVLSFGVVYIREQGGPARVATYVSTELG